MNALFLSYNGLLEPILFSQAVPYLRDLVPAGYAFTLLTYEKHKDLKRVGRAGIAKIKDSLAREGIDWVYLRYHKNPPLLSTLFDLTVGAFRVLYLIKSRGIKIAHIRGITPGIIMLMLSTIVKVKILFDMRGLLAEEYVGGGIWKEGGVPFRLVKWAEKRLLMQSDAVTVLTQKHLDLNKSLDYLAHKKIPMQVIPCCVDTVAFDYERPAGPDLREEFGLRKKFILLYPGKLSSYYFIDQMLAFFKYMISIIPEAVFFIVTPDDAHIVRDKARAYNIPDDKILVKTDVTFDKMPLYMRMADAGIFFISPYKKIGSSPIKLGEFLASGVPVIINPGVGDSEDLVRNNRVGAVVSKFDEVDYRSAIEELSALRKEGEPLRRRCRETAKKYLSKDEAVEKYARIYAVLASGIKERRAV